MNGNRISGELIETLISELTNDELQNLISEISGIEEITEEEVLQIADKLKSQREEISWLDAPKTLHPHNWRDDRSRAYAEGLMQGAMQVREAIENRRRARYEEMIAESERMYDENGNLKPEYYQQIDIITDVGKGQGFMDKEGKLHQTMEDARFANEEYYRNRWFGASSDAYPDLNKTRK